MPHPSTVGARCVAMSQKTPHGPTGSQISLGTQLPTMRRWEEIFCAHKPGDVPWFWAFLPHPLASERVSKPTDLPIPTGVFQTRNGGAKVKVENLGMLGSMRNLRGVDGADLQIGCYIWCFFPSEIEIMILQGRRRFLEIRSCKNNS